MKRTRRVEIMEERWETQIIQAMPSLEYKKRIRA
jgi:hypothetical protein